MTRDETLPAAPVSLTAWVRYDIETDWDYAYLTVDGTPVATNLSVNTNPNGQNFGEGITGDSGGAWVALTADLSAFGGGTHEIGFRYWTDGAVAPTGFEVDDIQINGTDVGDNETDAGWTLDGFVVSDGIETGLYFNAYVAEWRTYKGYDAGLKNSPYNFGFLDDGDLQNWVEHFPYQDGVLISYWDESFTDNNTSEHPGGGLILPIDAHPVEYYRPDNGTVMRARILAYDSTFTFEKTDAITLHFNSQAANLPSLNGVSLFDDSIQYWNAASPLAGVMNPDTGTTIKLVKLNGDGTLTLRVN
jgi:immune inhibitor A